MKRAPAATAAGGHKSVPVDTQISGQRSSNRRAVPNGWFSLSSSWAMLGYVIAIGIGR
jgi:hypothetical protein